MKSVKQYFKNELDVEILSSLHTVIFITMYGFYTWLDSNDGVPFLCIVQMFLIAYISSWLQKIMYLKKTVYKRFSYKLYIFLWNVIPFCIVMIGQYIFGWFHDSSTWVTIAFDITILLYYPIVCWLLELFYMQDTKELNDLLEGYKKSHR